MEIKSYAKINLGLDVIRKREDNYHELKMIMQTINLYDVIKIDVFENGHFNDDDNAFVFSLNQKIDKKYMNLLYPIIKPGKEAFILFKPESETLFSVGKGNDICVKKKEYSLNLSLYLHYSSISII